MGATWSLYNQEDKLRVDDLRTDQVRTILLAIPEKRLRDWFACPGGNGNWTPLRDIPEFAEAPPETFPEAMTVTQPVSRKPSAPPDFNRLRQSKEEAPVAAASIHTTLAIDVSTVKERRSARRYVRNLRFKLEHDQVQFECETLDISMSGLRLKDKLPPKLSKALKAHLSLGPKRVKVFCERVNDRQLKILDCESWEVLRHWIVSR